MDIPKSPDRFGGDALSLPDEFSDAARGAIATYMRESQGFADPMTPARVERTVGNLAYFAPGALSRRAFDAAALQPLADMLDQPNQPRRYQAAATGLLDYFLYSGDDRNPRSNGYVGTLLGDLPHIDNGANVYKERLDDAMLDRVEGGGLVTPDDWKSLRVGANVHEIERVSRRTNVEAQLARAALTIDRVVHAGDDDQELLRHVLQIESFYAPLLEIYGLHAFDMMAQSNVAKVRALRSGNEHVLEHAAATLDRAKQVSTDEIMRHFFGRHPMEYQFQTSQESLYDETIVFSSASLEALTDGKQSGELNTRFKTVGKYAMKLLRNDRYDFASGKQPADVFGMLAVLPNATQLGQFFSSTIEHVRSSRTIELVQSASKSKPIFIQGSPDYVRQVRQQMASDTFDQFVQVEVIDDVPPSDIYQVAKFTSLLTIDGQSLPVELQFQTKQDRRNARFGVPSHMNHNAGSGISSIVPGDRNELHSIFLRKHDVDPNGELVNPQSIDNGERFKEKFKAAVRLNDEQ